MVAPRVVAHPLPELVVTLHRAPGGALRPTPVLQPVGHPAREADPGDHRVEVCSGRVRSLLEVPEADVGDVAGIGGTQGHRAGAVLGVRLEHRPGQPVGPALEICGVPGVVALEVSRQREQEQVGHLELGPRLGDQRQQGAVRRVGTLPGVPLLQVGIRRVAGLRGVEGPTGDEREVLLELGDDADLVAVLQVGAHARRVDPHPDPVGAQLLGRTDTGELEQLGAVESPRGDDDLAASHHVERFAVRGGDLKIGPVEAMTFQAVHPDAASAGVDDQSGGQRVGEKPQTGGRRRSLNIGEDLARPCPAPAPDGQRDQPDAEHRAALRIGVVRVDEPAQLLPPSQPAHQRRGELLVNRGHHNPQELTVARDQLRIRHGRGQPAGKPMAGGREPVPQERDGQEQPRQEGILRKSVAGGLVGAALQPLEERAHTGRGPARVAEKLRERVRVVGVNGDQRVMGRAPPDGTSPRVEHAVVFGAELVIPPGLLVVIVVPNEEAPRRERRLRGVGVEGRHGVGVIVLGGASGLHDDDRVPGLRQAQGQRASPGPRADDHVISQERRGTGHRRRSRRSSQFASTARTVLIAEAVIAILVPALGSSLSRCTAMAAAVSLACTRIASRTTGLSGSSGARHSWMPSSTVRTPNSRNAYPNPGLIRVFTPSRFPKIFGANSARAPLITRIAAKIRFTIPPDMAEG